MKEVKYIFVIFLILICSSVTIATEKEKKDNPIQNHISLTPTNVDVNAKGFAEIFFKENKHKTIQRFSLKVEQLSRNALFNLTVNGLFINTFSTNSGGAYEAIYETNPKGSHLLLPAVLTPVTQIKSLEIRDSIGQLVLSGSFIPTSATNSCKSEELEQEISLLSTKPLPTPLELGVVEIKAIRENNITTSQELEVEVEKLPPRSIFELFVNNIHIGSFTVGQDGKAKIEFSNNPKKDELFLPTSINLFKVVSVAVKDHDNNPILLGSADNPDGNKIKFESDFTLASTIDSNAKARVETEVETEKGDLQQEFDLKIENVAPFSTLRLFIDNAEITTIQADVAGKSSLVMSTTPKGNQQRLPLLNLININLVELKTTNGDVLLSSAINLGNCENTKDRRKIVLTSTNLSLGVTGKSEITIKRNANVITEEEFSITIENLDPVTSYKLFVNNEEIATLTTNSRGSATLEFSTNPKGTEQLLPLVINPVSSIQFLEIRTLSGQVLLTGHF